MTKLFWLGVLSWATLLASGPSPEGQAFLETYLDRSRPFKERNTAIFELCGGRFYEVNLIPKEAFLEDLKSAPEDYFRLHIFKCLQRQPSTSAYALPVLGSLRGRPSRNAFFSQDLEETLAVLKKAAAAEPPALTVSRVSDVHWKIDMPTASDTVAATPVGLRDLDGNLLLHVPSRGEFTVDLMSGAVRPVCPRDRKETTNAAVLVGKTFVAFYDGRPSYAFKRESCEWLPLPEVKDLGSLPNAEQILVDETGTLFRTDLHFVDYRKKHGKGKLSDRFSKPQEATFESLMKRLTQLDKNEDVFPTWYPSPPHHRLRLLPKVVTWTIDQKFSRYQADFYPEADSFPDPVRRDKFLNETISSQPLRAPQAVRVWWVGGEATSYQPDKSRWVGKFHLFTSKQAAETWLPKLDPGDEAPIAVTGSTKEPVVGRVLPLCGRASPAARYEAPGKPTDKSIPPCAKAEAGLDWMSLVHFLVLKQEGELIQVRAYLKHNDYPDPFWLKLTDVTTPFTLRVGATERLLGLFQPKVETKDPATGQVTLKGARQFCGNVPKAEETVWVPKFKPDAGVEVKDNVRFDIREHCRT